MENRKMVEEHIKLRIGIEHPVTYKKSYTWKELMATKGILPTDVIYDLYYREEKESGMFSMKMEDELETYMIPTIEVIRFRLETDEEYFSRKQREQLYKTETEEKEKLEYLRLKAKFEAAPNLVN